MWLRFKLLLLLLLLAGCGYQMAGQTPIELPGGVKTLAIRNVTNPTTRTWIVPLLRSDLRDEITRRSDVLWKEVAQSEAVLDVDILNYTASSLLKGGQEETLKSQVNLSLEARLIRTSDQSLLWSSGPLVVSETFVGSSEERDAGEEAVEKAARRLADAFDQGF